MGKASRDKGKRVERKNRDVITKAGFSGARRRQQYSGTDGTDDLACKELDFLHLESKGEKTMRVQRWVDEAKEHGMPTKFLCIMWDPCTRIKGTSRFKTPMVLMPMDEFFLMLRQLTKGVKRPRNVKR